MKMRPQKSADPTSLTPVYALSGALAVMSAVALYYKYEADSLHQVPKVTNASCMGKLVIRY